MGGNSEVDAKKLDLQAAVRRATLEAQEEQRAQEKPAGENLRPTKAPAGKKTIKRQRKQVEILSRQADNADESEIKFPWQFPNFGDQGSAVQEKKTTASAKNAQEKVESAPWQFPFFGPKPTTTTTTTTTTKKPFSF